MCYGEIDAAVEAINLTLVSVSSQRVGSQVADQ